MFRLRRTMCVVLLAAAAAGLFFAAPGIAVEENDFWFRNMSGATISELYVSEGFQETWGNDVLGKNVLPHGQRVWITFRRLHCRYDVKVVWGGGQEWASPKKVNLCETNQLTINCNRNNCWLQAE